ncbi:serine hydrolase [Nocardia cyriacigeorgica]|nr:serine hydrolase [Nocardia cyriacigeorgica]
MNEPAPQPSRRRRYLLRAAVGFALTVVLLIAAAFGATSIMSLPSPPTLAQLMFAPPSTQGELFASRTVPASPEPRPLPKTEAPLPDTVPWKGAQITVSEFLDTTKTNSFVVLRDGVMIHEWYRDGVGPATKQSSWSVAKSVVSLLIGRAVDAGQMSEDDRLVDLLPELATGTDYDKVTIGDLLDMSSGIDVSENYNKWAPFTGTARMYLTTDLDEFVDGHRTLVFPPGSKGDYRSVDTQLLGMALARVTGTSLSELLARDLWAPIGAVDDGLWNLDREGGQEKAFCCLNATARDFAKIGQLVADGGRVGEQQIVPPAWIERISTPSPHRVSDEGYSAQWWHPDGGDGADLSAVGVYGQYIWVDPPSRTVIVKLSDYGTSQDETETFEVFRTIARAG